MKQSVAIAITVGISLIMMSLIISLGLRVNVITAICSAFLSAAMGIGVAGGIDNIKK